MLEKKEMLRMLCEMMGESGELLVRGRVKMRRRQEEGRATHPDQNRLRVRESVLII